MAWDGIHAGDYGWTGKLTLYQDGSAVDVSSYTTKVFVLRKPDGTEVSKTATFTTDGTDGVLQYQFVSGDVDTAGTWKVQARVSKTGVQLTSSYHTFDVDAALDA